MYDTLFLIFYFLPCGLGDMVYKCKFILALSSQFFLLPLEKRGSVMSKENLADKNEIGIKASGQQEPIL